MKQVKLDQARESLDNLDQRLENHRKQIEHLMLVINKCNETTEKIFSDNRGYRDREISSINEVLRDHVKTYKDLEARIKIAERSQEAMSAATSKSIEDRDRKINENYTDILFLRENIIEQHKFMQKLMRGLYVIGVYHIISFFSQLIPLSRFFS
jgi:ABC-type transporter Mla subunit MlaD